MSGMRFRSEMDVRVLKMMEGCCGPRDGHEWGEGRQWICSYHDGYNDGLQFADQDREERRGDGE